MSCKAKNNLQSTFIILRHDEREIDFELRTKTLRDVDRETFRISNRAGGEKQKIRIHL